MTALLSDLSLALTLFVSTNLDDLFVLIGIGAMVLTEAGMVSCVTGGAARG